MNSTEQKKKAVIEALKKTLGVVSAACEAVGIGRTIFYEWKKDDPEFRANVDDIEEYAIDFVESKLYEQIASNDTTSIIFYLKTKGKKRGYSERPEFEKESEAYRIFTEWLNTVKNVPAEPKANTGD